MSQTRVWVSLTLVFMIASSAHAQTLVLQGTVLHIAEGETEREVDVGCAGLQSLLVGRAAYIACGPTGVVRVDIDDLHVVHRTAPAVALLQVDDAVWGRFEDGSLHRIDGVHADPPPAERAPEQGPARPIGRVTRVDGGYALIELEEGASIAPGSTVEILRRPAANALQLDSERDDLVIVGRGVIEASSGHTARVRTEVDAAVRPGMWARPADPADLLLLPTEPVGLATLSVRLRPFIPMGILGIGVISDLSAGYTTDFGLAIRLELTGFAFGFARRMDPEAENKPLMPVIHGYAGAVTRWFELGVGLGWSRSYRVNAAPGNEFNEGFSVLMMARAGSEDGLSARLRVTLLVREVWEMGDFYADGRVPLAHGWWLIVGGGGGNTGVRYGEAGVRALVMGSGLGGSIFLHATLGVGMIEQGANFSNAGPMIGLGLDARI